MQRFLPAFPFHFVSLRFVLGTCLLTGLLGMVVGLGGCKPAENSPSQPSESTEKAAQPAVLLDAQGPAASITGEELAGHVKTLASDAFGGRAPSSPGGAKTVAYIAEHFKQLGLEPGFGDSYTQQVPLVSIKAEPDMALTVTGTESGKPLSFDYKTDMMAWTKRVTEHVELNDSELVFVGYGIVAPEYNWNDYVGVDVEGKTVVVLVNDPGFATQNPELFTGNRMTYYGRWTYKYEEAARQGAAGAIIVHETAPAGYPWDVVSGSWSGKQFSLESENNNMDRVKVEGWITHEAANKLFAATGLDYEALQAKAASRDFEALPLGMSASIRIDNTLQHSTSRNVMGVLPGSERADETIIYMAHWDHLGTDPTLEGDPIYNGAQDNATGVAALIEMAEAFGKMQPAAARSVAFLAVTAEESGLLGSKWYAEHPPIPLSSTVGGINIDSMGTFGLTRDIVVVGYGKSEMEDYLQRAAEEQNRVLVPEKSPEKGYYYRSDHFNMAKFGVPMLYIHTGVDHVTKGKDYGHAQHEEYTAERYHKPADEFSTAWDMSGIVGNARLYFMVGEMLATNRDWPEWNKGTEFRAIRQQSRAALTDSNKTPPPQVENQPTQ